jgi:hypothetical protein
MPTAPCAGVETRAAGARPWSSEAPIGDHESVTSRRVSFWLGAAGLAAALGGCGLNVASPDLFVLTRTGQGSTLTLLVNDGGTVKCNGAAPRTLPDPQLLAARDLAAALDTDVRSHLKLVPAPHSVYRFSVKLQDGTLTFPDTAAASHKELARAELFALQIAQTTCR